MAAILNAMAKDYTLLALNSLHKNYFVRQYTKLLLPNLAWKPQRISIT